MSALYLKNIIHSRISVTSSMHICVLLEDEECYSFSFFLNRAWSWWWFAKAELCLIHWCETRKPSIATSSAAKDGIENIKGIKQEACLWRKVKVFFVILYERRSCKIVRRTLLLYALTQSQGGMMMVWYVAVFFCGESANSSKSKKNAVGSMIPL